jgi:hypothetical protein
MKTNTIKPFFDFFYAGEHNGGYKVEIKSLITDMVIGIVNVYELSVSARCIDNEIIFVCKKKKDELFIGTIYENIAEMALTAYLISLAEKENLSIFEENVIKAFRGE